MEIHANTGAEAFHATVQALLAEGRSVSPRGRATRELTNFRLTVSNPGSMSCEGVHPGFSRAIAACEALHLISGERYGNTMHRLTRGLGSIRWGSNLDNTGSRLRDQLEHIVELLVRDPDSRQAVGLIWRTEDHEGNASFLCATQVQYLVRDGRLHAITTMRSNDVWNGLPNNLFAFGQLQLTLANALRVEPGTYTHAAASMHLYERHREAAEKVEPPTGVVADPAGLNGPGDPGLRRWKSSRNIAEWLLDNVPFPDPNLSEVWYRTNLHGKNNA